MFAKEFKLTAVRRLEQEVSIGEVARSRPAVSPATIAEIRTLLRDAAYNK